MSLAYRMQEASREEMAAADPFDGQGVFLAAPGTGTADLLERVARCIGGAVPAVAWGGIGAWVLAGPGSSGMNSTELRDLWDGGRASDHG